MPKATKLKSTENAVATVVDRTKKRKASSSPGKKAKKTTTTTTENLTESNEENHEVKQSMPMNFQTSDRLSCTGEKSNLKIVSWNVNGIRAWLTNGGLKYLEREQADIICFQELKCDREKIPVEATPTGYKSFWLSGDQAGYSGVGLLTKVDPIAVTFGINLAEHDTEGRIITAEYDKFYLVIAYIPNSGRKLVRLTYRRQFNEAFHRYLKDLEQKKPVIWCGDLNVSHQEIDLANPKTNTKTAGFTKEEREDFSKILNDGFIDSFRYLYPDRRDAYTYWAYFRNARQRNIGWRLDYFILSSPLQQSICDVLIQNGVYGSDHCPIVLFLNL